MSKQQKNTNDKTSDKFVRRWETTSAAAGLRGAFLLLALAALWLNWPDGGHPTASSQLVFVPAEVTAVLSDDAQPDFENSEGRRIGTQKLEIRVLSGEHRGEILPLTNYMSALFNVDVDRGDRVIGRGFQNGAHQVEPQPHAVLVPAAGLIRLVEPLEDHGQVLGGQCPGPLFSMTTVVRSMLSLTCTAI